METPMNTYPTFTVTEQDDLEYNYVTNAIHDDSNIPLKYPLWIFSIAVYSVAFVLGTTGNGLVIFFAVFKMKRTVNVIWFLNLAIADFTFTFFLPLSIAYTALGFHWPFGKFMCKLSSTILFINLYASVYLLTLISIDRCTSVMFPVWSQNHRTPRAAIFAAMVVWILAFIFSIPYFIFRDTEIEEDIVYCFNNFPEDSHVAYSLQKAIIIMRFITSFAFPFALMILSYAIIMLRIQRNRMKTTSKPFKVIVAVIISFFVCWFPYHVFNFLEFSAIYGKNHLWKVIDIGTPFVTSLAFINSCINPVLYVFMGRDFKTKFRRSFRSVFERAFMEENVLTSFRGKTKSNTKSTSDSQMV